MRRTTLLVGLLLMATITNLSVAHRAGQTVVTFTKNAGAGTGTTVGIRRHTSQITSASDGTLIATVDAKSWQFQYPAGASIVSPDLSSGFIVTDEGTPLASTQGLFVHTTATDGTFFYAGFTSDDPTTVSAGNNTTTSGTVETYRTTPGGIRLRKATNGDGSIGYVYFVWRDYSTWDTAEWGYYGHKVSFCVPSGAGTFPILLEGHSAGGWNDPGFPTSNTVSAIQVFMRDNTAGGTADPYATSNPAYDHSYFWGRYNTSANRFVPCDEDRICDYLKLIRDDAFGDGQTFKADTHRIVADGASLGSATMFLAAHHPELFSAVIAEIGTTLAIHATAPANTLMSTPAWVTWEHYGNLKWLAENGYVIAPTMHTYNKDDPNNGGSFNYPAALTALETAKLAHASQWHDGAHGGFYLGHYIDTDNSPASGKQWDPYRFLLNESYPAFATSSNSDAVGTISGTSNATGAAGNAGQRNYWLDWQSSLHAFSGGSAISDASGTYAISLKSYSGTATGVGLTIRNAQAFLPSVGSTVTWATDNAQSGTATLNSDGSVTATGLSIPTTAIRLTFISTSSAGHFATVFAGAIR